MNWMDVERDDGREREEQVHVPDVPRRPNSQARRVVFKKVIVPFRDEQRALEDFSYIYP